MVRASVGGGGTTAQRYFGKPAGQPPAVRKREIYGGHRRHSHQPMKQYQGLSPASPLNKVNSEIKMKSYQEIYNSTMEAMNQGYNMEYSNERSSPKHHKNRKWKQTTKRSHGKPQFREAVKGIGAHKPITKNFITGTNQLNSMMTLDQGQAQHPSVRAQSTEYQKVQLNNNVDKTMKHLKQKLEHRRASTSVLQHFESQQHTKSRLSPTSRPMINKQTYQSQLVKPDQDMSPSVKKLNYHEVISPNSSTKRRHSYSSHAVLNSTVTTTPSKLSRIETPTKKDKNHKIPSIKMLTSTGKKKIINATALEKASQLLGLKTEKTTPETLPTTSPAMKTPSHMFDTSIVTPDSSSPKTKEARSPEVIYPSSPLNSSPKKKRKRKEKTERQTRTPEPLKTENVQPLMLLQNESPPSPQQKKRKERRRKKKKEIKMEISSSTATESTISNKRASPPPQIVELRKSILHGGHWYLKPIKKRLLIEHWLDDQVTYQQKREQSETSSTGSTRRKKKRPSTNQQHVIGPMVIQTLRNPHSRSPRQIRLDRANKKDRSKKKKYWH